MILTREQLAEAAERITSGKITKEMFLKDPILQSIALGCNCFTGVHNESSKEDLENIRETLVELNKVGYFIS